MDDLGTASVVVSRQDLHNQIYADLSEAAEKGYGSEFSKFGTDVGTDMAVLEMRRNLYKFSHAKTVVELEELNEALYDGNRMRQHKEFRERVDLINAKYNRHHLETEYNTARNAAEHARKWNEYQEDAELFPNLKYMTVADGRVRQEHSALHGVIKPMNDDFWSKYYPPNGWNCRCYVVQTAEDPDKGKFEDDTVPKEFIGNVGKDTVIFSNEQNYFKIEKEIGGVHTAEIFEHSKKFAPVIKAFKDKKSGGAVDVSPWADTSKGELFGNYKVAVLMAQNKGLKVQLRPHLDGMIIKGEPNPEYLINGKIADRKSPTGNRLSNLLRRAEIQKCETVVFDLHQYPKAEEDLLKQLKGNFQQDESYPTISKVIIISKDRKKVTVHSRKDIKK